MLKLYRLDGAKKEYWETWDNGDGKHTVHWGDLGTRGASKIIQASGSEGASDIVQRLAEKQIADGFRPVDLEQHAVLMIEFTVEGMGSKADVEKRHRLEDRMNETLGWTGLGACDGGSIGSGTMEVCNFVVDFEVAKQVVMADLAESEFSNYSRIYDEGAD